MRLQLVQLVQRLSAEQHVTLHDGGHVTLRHIFTISNRPPGNIQVLGQKAAE